MKSLTSDAELEIYPVAKVLAAKDITPSALIDQLQEELGAELFAAEGGPLEMRYDASSQCILVRLPQAQQRALEEYLGRAGTE